MLDYSVGNVKPRSTTNRMAESLMDETVYQEGLLRHLLSERHLEKDDEFIYSFLLGSRLFLSPHQLLTELNRLANEEASDHVMDEPDTCAGNVCSKCRQMHKRRSAALLTSSRASVSFPDSEKISSSSSSVPFPRGTDFRSAVPAEDSTDGEDTIRRRKRGRRRSQGEATSSSSTNSSLALPERVVSSGADRSSVVSRDSGILSAVLEFEVLDTTNNNQHPRAQKSSALPIKVPLQQEEEPSSSSPCNDSGMILDMEEDEDDLCECHSSALPGNHKASSRKRQLVHVLHEWVRNFPADFRNKKVMWTLNDVIKSCQADQHVVSSNCTEVMDCISRRAAAQESYEQHLCDADLEDALQRADCSRKSRDKLVATVTALKNAADVNQMAQQLCLIEVDFLKHVGAEEFLQLFTANGEEDVRTNLGACVRWFNRLSHLVATVICMCRKRKRARHVITLFARVANRCFELSNFNSSMAILTGLSLGPVTRLKRTWNKLKLSELSKLQNAFDPANNFQKYRTIYASRIGSSRVAVNPMSREQTPDQDATNRYSIISQHSVASVTSTCSQHGDSGIECDHDASPGCVTSPGVTSSPSKPKPVKKHFKFDRRGMQDGGLTVPFLVLMVKDVYFLNHAIHTVHKDGSINFEKLRQLSNLLRPLEEWKQIASPYPKDASLQHFLLHTPVLTDEDLYLNSYKREAPTNRFEKQQLKTLRADRDAKKRSGSRAVKAAKKRNDTGIVDKAARRKTM